VDSLEIYPMNFLLEINALDYLNEDDQMKNILSYRNLELTYYVK